MPESLTLKVKKWHIDIWPVTILLHDFKVVVESLYEFRTIKNSIISKTASLSEIDDCKLKAWFVRTGTACHIDMEVAEFIEVIGHRVVSIANSGIIKFAGSPSNLYFNLLSDCSSERSI